LLVGDIVLEDFWWLLPLIVAQIYFVLPFWRYTCFTHCKTMYYNIQSCHRYQVKWLEQSTSWLPYTI
jgi:hypothetical protein